MWLKCIFSDTRNTFPPVSLSLWRIVIGNESQGQSFRDWNQLDNSNRKGRPLWALVNVILLSQYWWGNLPSLPSQHTTTCYQALTVWRMITVFQQSIFLALALHKSLIFIFLYNTKGNEVGHPLVAERNVSKISTRFFLCTFDTLDTSQFKMFLMI